MVIEYKWGLQPEVSPSYAPFNHPPRHLPPPGPVASIYYPSKTSSTPSNSSLSWLRYIKQCRSIPFLVIIFTTIILFFMHLCCFNQANLLQIVYALATLVIRPSDADIWCERGELLSCRQNFYSLAAPPRSHPRAAYFCNSRSLTLTLFSPLLPLSGSPISQL